MIGVVIPVVRLADSQLRMSNVERPNLVKKEELLNLTKGDTFTLTSWQFKFQLCETICAQILNFQIKLLSPGRVVI